MIGITEKQYEEMKHALGWDRVRASYRNKYYVYEIDEDWEDLIKKGLANVSIYVENSSLGKYGYFYYVTEKGISQLKQMIKERENKKVWIARE